MSGGKGFRSRMGAAVRRSSSILSISRPGTPSRGDSASETGSVKQPSSDSEPLKALDTAPATLSPPTLAARMQSPSPIAESPAREAAALAAEPTEPAGPSPLSQAVTDSPPVESSELPATTSADVQTPQNADGNSVQQESEISREIPDEQHSTSEPESKPIAQPVPQRALESSPFGPSNATNSEEAISMPIPDAYRTLTPKASDRSLKASTRSHGDGKLSSKPSKTPMNASDVWGSRDDQERFVPPFVVQSPGNGDATYAWGVMPSADPFADHAPSGSNNMPISATVMPKPDTRDPTFNDDVALGPMLMPVPPLHDAVSSMPIRKAPSAYSVGNGSARAPVDHETDETRPLLSRPHSPQPSSYLRPAAPASLLPKPSSSSVSTSVLQSLGWLEYILPDSTFYYVHPTMRVTTDVDLRNHSRLQAVSAYLEGDELGKGAKGLESWLRDVGNKKHEFHPVRMWVDHKTRRISFEQHAVSHMDESKANEDRLDMEYRYWSFMEAHPAHAGLPLNARMEAMDTLTWSYTDRLLPSHRPIPPPFTQEECQELMNLLRSFGGDSSDSGIQSVVHTRIVSRILLRVAHWRQVHFRPDKPLPKDVSDKKARRHERRRPFGRAVVDFVISCLCLGIPYLFLDRSHHHRMDEESGIRSAGPVQMLVIGSCACVVAAIILSASVTFVTLPGLDSIARVAGFVAIMCSTASLASAVMALFRYKVNMERELSCATGEGIMTLSRRSIVMSLPLVFLAYGVAAFTTGVVMFSFRGVTLTNPSMITRHFEEYTRWTVVGTLGGLAGMLILSTIIARR